MDIKERIQTFIDENADEATARYTQSLVTSAYEIKGVKISKLESLAKELAEEGVKINKMPITCHEEVLLAGMTIAYSKCKAAEKVKQFKALLPYLDNWETCDTIVPRLKGLESQREFFVELLESNKPFYIRAGIIWFKKFELKKDSRKVVNLLNEKVKNTNYYVEMALAWTYAEAMIKDYEYMVEFVQNLERYIIRNRTLQKACESYRVSDERKKEIRALRSKLLGMEI